MAAARVSIQLVVTWLSGATEECSSAERRLTFLAPAIPATPRFKMVDLLLLAHAPLASACAEVAAHAFPEAASRLRWVDVAPQEDMDAVVARLRNTLPDGETLILADVFGATPCNAALRVADGSRVRVVAGLNVPMLWRSLCYAHEPLDRLVARAVEGGAQCVMQVSTPRPQNQSLQSPPSHDQRDHRHQQ
ncbi:MAG: hypothetical protein RL458_1530 [Pseudomonadota bacterium]|jgi:PTS system ascorbate-specific IIA component